MFKHGIGKCRVCEHFISEEQGCKCCKFEWATEYPATNDDKWDILNLDDDIEWTHLQIMDRLNYKGINVFQVINWYDSDIIILTGCTAYISKIADALGVLEHCISQDIEMGLIVVNLFKEKYYRKLMEE